MNETVASTENAEKSKVEGLQAGIQKDIDLYGQGMVGGCFFACTLGNIDALEKKGAAEIAEEYRRQLSSILGLIMAENSSRITVGDDSQQVDGSAIAEAETWFEYMEAADFEAEMMAGYKEKLSEQVPELIEKTVKALEEAVRTGSDQHNFIVVSRLIDLAEKWEIRTEVELAPFKERYRLMKIRKDEERCREGIPFLKNYIDTYKIDRYGFGFRLAEIYLYIECLEKEKS